MKKTTTTLTNPWPLCMQHFLDNACRNIDKKLYYFLKLPPKSL